MGSANFAFNELSLNYQKLPQLKSFVTRDNSQLSYRQYSNCSDNVLILLHGSGWHSQYFMPLSQFISSNGIAQVYTPDLRGHGISPIRRGDVDYISQLEDDLADFISHVKKENPSSKIILGGHSSGGGLAIRFAGSKYENQVDAYLLLSPWLKYNAPTIRPISGGWGHPYTRRIIGLEILNKMGIRWFNHLTVIKFAMPKEMRNGSETLSYSYRLNSAYAPRNYKTDLAAIKKPLLVVAGELDEIFFAERFEAVISKYTKAKVVLLPNVTHLGIVVNPIVMPVVTNWIESLNSIA